MKTWNELKDVQLPLTYGELLAAFATVDTEFVIESNKHMRAGRTDVAESIQSNRNAIAKLLHEIKTWRKDDTGRT
jgi:hypothetical protein